MRSRVSARLPGAGLTVAGVVVAASGAATGGPREAPALIIGSVLFVGGMQLGVLGLVGVYISRLYDEARGRPLYLIRDVIETAHE
jgi:hypothetical protein